YHIDRKAGTAALVWEYRSPDDGHSTATGAFRRYAEGSDNLIAWGFKPRSLFTEVDARRKVLLNVALSGGDLAYRAVKTAPDQFDVDLLHSTAGLPAASFPVAPRVLSLGLETRDRSDRASVVITGTGLSGATDVKFGSAKASAVSVASDGLIKAVAPPGTESVAVTVTSPGGTSNRQSLN